MKYTEDFLKEVRDRIVIEELIGDYVKLKKQGTSLVAPCPFHTEKTASFHVSPSKKLYHCFGCGKGSDGIGFLMEFENLSFAEAVKTAAQKFNIVIPASAKDKEYDQQVSLQKEIIKMNRNACDHWKTQVDTVKPYLTSRDITEETIETFEIGYASDERDELIKLLLDAEHSKGDIKVSGLAIESSNHKEYFDKFRDRLMIPILDVRGRVVAFNGRAMGKVEPKYLNSPETSLYTKGEHFYGLFQSKEAIRTKGFVIITEGCFDFLRLYQSGITNVVASLGTALSDVQAKLLKRFTDKALICYDGDDAGQKATETISEILNKHGFTVKVISLPDNLDPDDYIRKFGVDTFNTRRKQSLNWFNFYIERLKSRFDIKNPKTKSKAVEDVLVKLSAMTNEIERREYFDQAMKLLKVDSILHNSLWTKLHQSNKSIKSYDLNVKPSLAETHLLELAVCGEVAKETITSKMKCLDDLGITPILSLIADNPEEELNYPTTIEKLDSEEDRQKLCAALVKADETTEHYKEDLQEEIESCIEALSQLRYESQLEEISNLIKTEENDEKVIELLSRQAEIIDCMGV